MREPSHFSLLTSYFSLLTSYFFSTRLRRLPAWDRSLPATRPAFE